MIDAMSLPLEPIMAEALEAMACLCVWRAEPPAPAPGPGAVLVSIEFVAGGSGTFQMLAPAAFGAAVAAGLLGTTPDDPRACALAEDAMKELMNVACGVLLRRAAPPVQMGLPVLAVADRATRDAFAAAPRTCRLDAEGLPVWVRLNGSGT